MSLSAGKLEPGERVVGVDGADTSRLGHDTIVAQLKTGGCLWGVGGGEDVWRVRIWYLHYEEATVNVRSSRPVGGGGWVRESDASLRRLLTRHTTTLEMTWYIRI